jgi:carbohydrate kinase of FGGY family protein
VDEGGNPIRPGILSLDSRAYQVLKRWEESRVLDRALEFNGQIPFAALPATLLAWFKENEPETLERALVYLREGLAPLQAHRRVRDRPNRNEQRLHRRENSGVL